VQLSFPFFWYIALRHWMIAAGDVSGQRFGIIIKVRMSSSSLGIRPLMMGLPRIPKRRSPFSQ
jgi:hypothetical protein